jgi:hypothetical protein
VLTLPPDIVAVLTTFAPVFSRPVWCHVQVLLVGSILAPGARMVTSALRVLGLLVTTFAPDGPVVIVD